MADDRGFGSGPVVVVAFEGWNDAGEAATGVVSMLSEQLDATTVFEVDPEDYFDYQFNRPMVSTNAAGERVIDWPSVALERGEADGLPVYLVSGVEPSRGWKTFCSEIVDHLLAVDASGVIFLGAMLADVPHTRPIAVFAGSENAELRERYGLEPSTYEGPTGIIGVLADAVERAGVPTMSIWASVPHYVHNAPSPKATLALVERLEEFIPFSIDRGTLPDDAAAWESGINELADDDEDMAAYIEQLEQARDTVDSPEASGEAIAEEFERYLRRRQGRAGEKD